MVAELNEIESVVKRLEAAPGRFAALLSSLEDADSIERLPGDGSTPEAVFAHLRAANAILEPRIYFVLVRDNPPLVGYDDARWLEVARYASLPVTDSLETMRLYRSELVYMLRGITLDDWDRTGTHEVRGPMTVLELAQQIAEQDDDHLKQIQKSVGSWFEC